MKTHTPTEKSLEKRWLLVDVKGKTLGKTAVKIADLLRGKQKPFFTPQLDCGDYVVAINARHIRLAKNKVETKLYQWHTRYPKGFRQRTAKEMLEKKPEKVLFNAVWGMMPRNKLRNNIIKKLRVYPDETHEHTAQKLQSIEL